jgi:ribosome-associated protein
MRRRRHEVKFLGTTLGKTSGEQIKQTMTETIKLDQFLKLAQVVETGGQAKHVIQSGLVMVNGAVEVRRGRKLVPGDVVNVDGEELIVASDEDE